MINLKFNNPTTQGNVGLGRSIAYYTSLGYTVLLPLNDSEKYDLIYDNGGKLVKVQVKTCRGKTNNGVYNLQLKTVSGRKILGFDHRNFDEMFILCENNEVFIVPSDFLKDYKSAITINKLKDFKVIM